ncbi:MAG: DUF2290 domain-containing protein [Chitinophagales bacterium]|nr:DUF2290 domain-containing protein [Chitinophagales bacterium]
MNSIENVIVNLKTIEKIFSNFIQESNFIRVEDKITWPDFKSGINKSLYMRQYETLLNSRQYTFLLSNKSFIQLYFEFTKEQQIKTIKYAYYPYPIILNEAEHELECYFDNQSDIIIGQFYFDLLQLMSEEMGVTLDDNQRKEAITFFKETYNYELDDNFLREITFDKIYSLTNYSHFRMDFDSTVLTHHKCEFQFGSVKQLRLPISKILSPFIFVDYIFRYFFKNEYQSLIASFNYKRNFISQKNECLNVLDFKEHNFFNII